MITKTCKKCSSELPEDSGFYANDNTCKECRKVMARENRARNIEYYRQYDRERANLPDRVKAREEYSKTPEGIEAANRAKNKWTQINAKKRWATNAVNNAIRDGHIVKPDFCSECGKTDCRIEGHHCDYNRPLDVIWLCSACHKAWHKKNGEGENAN